MRFLKLIIIIICAFSAFLNYSTSFSKIQNNNLPEETKPAALPAKPQTADKNSKPKAKKAEFSSNSKTTIKSKTINIKRKSGQIEFLEDAIVENADTSILADKIVVFYDDKKSKDNVIKNIVATGNVKIFNQEFVATGEEGSYDPKKEIFTITKNVIFNNGTSIASGDKFIYEVKTQKGFLTANNKIPSNTRNGVLKGNRVTVIINQYNE